MITLIFYYRLNTFTTRFYIIQLFNCSVSCDKTKVSDCWDQEYVENFKIHKFELKTNFLLPCLIWHKSGEVMKRNDEYVFLYIYFTPRTIRVHRLSVEKRLFLPTLVSRIVCCEFSRYCFRLDWWHDQWNNCFSLQKFITNNSWDCGSKYFAGGTGDRYKKGSCIWEF